MEAALRIPIHTLHNDPGQINPPPSWRLWAAIGLTAVILRLGFSIGLGMLWHPEPWEQEEIANHLLAGDGFIYEYLNTIYRSYCEPLYPYLAAAVYAVTRHSQPALVLVQILFSAATAVFAAQCGWHVTRDRRVSVCAGFLVAIHPGLVLYSMKLHPLVLDSFFFTLVAWACLRYAHRPTPGEAARIGILSGLCALTRPTILAGLPWICGWVWRMTASSRGSRLKRVALLLALAAASLSPWVIRNYAVHGQFMLTRSNTPFVFWLGNNPRATGSALDQQGQPVIALAPPELLKKLETADELTQNRLFGEAARAFVLSDPWGFVWRTWKKWTYFWWFTPQAGLLYPRSWFQFYRVWWFLLACAGLWGLWKARTLPPISRASFWFLVGIAAAAGAAQSLFYIEGRHRLAIEPVLSCMIAFGLVKIGSAVLSALRSPPCWRAGRRPGSPPGEYAES